MREEGNGFTPTADSKHLRRAGQLVCLRQRRMVHPMPRRPPPAAATERSAGCAGRDEIPMQAPLGGNLRVHTSTRPARTPPDIPPPQLGQYGRRCVRSLHRDALVDDAVSAFTPPPSRVLRQSAA